MSSQRNNYLISLFTDASYNDKVLRGGWGAWARSTEGRVFNGGGMYRDVQDSSEAEYVAALEGIIMVVDSPLIQQGASILLQTDNHRVASMMPIWSPSKDTSDVSYPAKSSPRNMNEENVFREIKHLAERWNLHILGRHIKGHTSSKKATRNYVNNLCDKMANQGRKRAEGVKITPDLRVAAKLHGDEGNFQSAQQMNERQKSSGYRNNDIRKPYIINMDEV